MHPTRPTPPLELPPQSAPPANGKRTKLWELEEKYHCPVIGTCLPPGELQRFAKRFRFAAPLKDEFGLHVEAITWSMSRNEVSETLQRHLDHKFAQSLQRFDSYQSESEVLAAWTACLNQGEVAGPLWAAYTHKATSPEGRHRLYADVHMLSHQVGAGQAADARRLRHLEQELPELRQMLNDERRHHARTLDALPAVALAVAGRIPILLDGGIRRGTDVLKALALGANAVMIGRAYTHALAAAGPVGVAHVLRLLRDEFEVAMALTGCAVLDDIGPHVLFDRD